MIDLGKITQGERGTLTVPWEFPEYLTSPASVEDTTITATMTDENGDTTAVSGTLTGTAATTCTWSLSAGDSGTAGTFTVLFQAIVTGVTTYTLEATLEVIANPSVTGTQNDPLVSISAADAAWVTLAATAVPDGGDIIPDAPSDGTQYARQDGDWAAVNAVSDVGDLTTTGLTAANMLRVASGGGLEERTPAQVLGDIGAQAADADLTAIAGLSSADSNFIVGSATGWVAESGATARTSLGLGTIATAAAGDYHLTTAFSASPTAAEPLKADGSGGLAPKTLDLRGASVSDFTALFPGKAATAYGIITQTSVATGGISVNGFTNTTATAVPFAFTAYHGSTAPTVSAIVLRAAKHNGTTSAVALAFAEAVFQLRNWTSNVMTVLGSGAVGIRVDAPLAQLHMLVNGASAKGQIIQMPTSATGNAFEVQNVSAEVLALIGPNGNMALGQQSTASHEISGKLKSSTTANTQAARIAWAWGVSTHATRTAVLSLYASDYGGERTGIQVGANGTEATLGFYGVTPTARQLLATGTGASVDDVIGALQTLGLLKQS